MYKVLSELVEINPRTDIPADASTSMKVSFIPMSDVTEYGDWIGNRERALGSVQNGFTAFADGDVLVAKITPCFENGKGAHVIGLTNGIGFGSTEFHVLRAHDGVSQRFIHHVAQSTNLRRTAEAFMSGSAGQRRVPSDFFEYYLVPDISFEEQDALGKILDMLDTMIRQTEAIIEKLKQVKQGLLHDLLTRGIDDNGELRPPQSQAPHLYKDSPLGWIPIEWNIELLGNKAEIFGGITLGRSISGMGVVELPYLRVANVQDGYLDLADIKFVRVLSSEIPRFRLECGDVLMNEGGDFDKLGRGAIWSGQIDNCLHQNHVFRVRCDKLNLNPHYLTAYSGSTFGRAFFVQASKQTTNLASINSTQLKGFPLRLPPITEQDEIYRRLASLDCRIEAESLICKKLQNKKAGLMDDLLTGRVRVTPLLETLGA